MYTFSLSIGGSIRVKIPINSVHGQGSGRRGRGSRHNDGTETNTCGYEGGLVVQ